MRNSQYQITETIHEGKRSKVLRAETSNGQKLVLKVPVSDASGRLKERLKTEYAILKEINHLNVVKAVLLEEDSGALVMEDFGGQSLKRFFSSKGLDIRLFLEIAICICEGLRELHSHNIIHKDIKPDNIIINPETQETRIIDFSLATQLSRESQGGISPDSLEGTLAYISPEQTGRMNRTIDYRTDFYSLGISFYQLLTGRLPFESEDAMEIVHGHIAKLPPKVHEVNPAVPITISRIVAKLMHKNAENRYQSAYGLLLDLQECLKVLNETGVIPEFQIGRNDMSRRLIIPEKLYGREEELEKLNEGFDKAANGEKQIILFVGESGIGKSALINEIHKPVVTKRGFFICGKFDQFKRNIPYSSIINAFNGLIREILSEKEKLVQFWKTKILNALGNNGKVITDVIPDLELLIGKQPEIQSLPPQESQNRFNIYFQNFIRVFADKSHPLVLFLDDLQWVDNASLKLLETLFTDPELNAFLLLGAYRDNEVCAAHPFVLMLDNLSKEGYNHLDIKLKTLNETDVVNLTSESLNVAEGDVRELAAVVFEKTAGNPFFVKEFLTFLEQEELIKFDKGWKWDVPEIRQLGITDNVVDLMTGKIEKQNHELKNLLSSAACIGNSFDINTLHVALGVNLEKLEILTKDAVNEGFVIKTEEKIRFIHDKIQEASYLLLGDDEKQNNHYNIGKHLYENALNDDVLDEYVFDIVNQLNKATNKISEEEKTILLELNCSAGQQAKAAVAYDAAINYFEKAKSLLPDNSWTTEYKYNYLISFNIAECQYIGSNYNEAIETLNSMSGKVTDLIDNVEILKLFLLINSALENYSEVMDLGVKALRLLGFNVKKNVSKLDILWVVLKFNRKLKKVKIENIEKLPLSEDPKLQLAFDVVENMTAILYSYNASFLFYCFIYFSYLCLRYGNTKSSAWGYTMYVILLMRTKKFDQAFRMIDSITKLSYKASSPRTLNKTIWTNSFHASYKESFSVTLDGMLETSLKFKEVGDTEFLSYCYTNLPPLHMYKNSAIGEIIDCIKMYKGELYKTKHGLSVKNFNLYYQAILNFSEGLVNEREISGTILQNEISYIDDLVQKNDENLILYYMTIKSIHAFVFEYDFLENLMEYFFKYANNYKYEYRYYVTGFYISLTILKNQEKAKIGFVTKFLKALEMVIKLGGPNYTHRYYLLLAELFKGKTVQKVLIEDEVNKFRYKRKTTEQLFDLSIAYAKKNKFILEEAIANECAATYYLSKNLKRIASVYIQEAVSCYKKWGSKPKVNLLIAKHSDLLLQHKLLSESENATQEQLSETTYAVSETSFSSGNYLDINTVMKSTQALSGEVKLASLLEKMLNILIENAGADKGCLVMKPAEKWVIEAFKDIKEKKDNILGSIDISGQDGEKILSEKIVNYTLRTKETVVLNISDGDSRFENDIYIREKKPKSLLSMPLLNKGKLIGSLYLENNVAENAFTPEQVKLLGMLSSQMAISYENALLYDNLEQKVKERTKKITQQKNAIESSIQYASTIQSAILPEKKELDTFFDNFVLFRPKDIVSGDFYWFAHVPAVNGTKEKVFLAAVDCTGHGVPGAFMSMIGSSLLNKIVREMKIYQPSRILELLHQDVKIALKQETTDNDDGMDICLCCFEADEGKNTKVTFSGAKRPLLIFRNKTSELNICKGVHKTIGGKYYDKMSFADEEIVLAPYDMVFLTSDGYVDQSNKQRKRFKMSKFSELLRQNANLDTPEQLKLLESALDGHQNETTQRDDITVLGVKLPLKLSNDKKSI